MNKGKQNGITLIALIITIIIMLILVAVTVKVAIDGNLFGKAEDAVSKTNAKVGKLQQDVDYYTNKLNEASERANDLDYSWENRDSGYSDDGIGLVMGVYIEEGKYFKPSKYAIPSLGLEKGAKNNLVGLNNENVGNVEIKKVMVINSNPRIKSLEEGIEIDYARQYADYAQYATRKILKDEKLMREYYNSTGSVPKNIKLGSNRTVTASDSEIFELARQDAIEMAEKQAIFKEGTSENYILNDGVISDKKLNYIAKDGTTKSIEILNIPAIVDGLKIVTKENYNSKNRFLVEDTKVQMDGLTDRLAILQEYNIRTMENIVENTQVAESRIRDTDMADEMLKYSENNVNQVSLVNGSEKNENKIIKVAISEKMRTQIRGLTQASANAADAASLCNTAEEVMAVMTIAMNKELEYFNEAAALYDRPSTLDRENSLKNIDQKIKEMVKVIDYIANSTEFNTVRLLDGSFSNKAFQVGTQTGQTISISIEDVTVEGLGIQQIGCSTKEELESSRAKVIEAKQKLVEQRQQLGTLINRLEHTINNLDNVVENTPAE